MTITEKKKHFNQMLFRWHKAHYREMAWRNTRNPYRILVSEVMLQQTQVERVREKYAEFLKQFPSVHILAKAQLGDVIRAWSGLGYNRRAKYLHECVKEVLLNHQGKFPNDMTTLMTLPGIGLSTAGALQAFAFGEDEPMIDTNIRRILTRTFFSPKMSRLRLDMVGVSDKELYVFAKSLIPKGKGREWNYAMLDLGATLCTARHHSKLCPLAKLHGPVSDFVYKKPQKKFANSDRFYRGRILSQLLISPHTSESLQEVLALEQGLLHLILTKLAKEHLIVVSKKSVTLP